MDLCGKLFSCQLGILLQFAQNHNVGHVKVFHFYKFYKSMNIQNISPKIQVKSDKYRIFYRINPNVCF